MLTITESAGKAVARFVQSSPSPEGGVRIAVVTGGCNGYEYKMSVEAEARDDDTVVRQGNAQLFVDTQSLALLEGATVDFIDSMTGAGFKFVNPNATSACGCGNSFSC